MSIRGKNSQRIRGCHEELFPENHVPVGVTITGSSEIWDRREVSGMLVDIHDLHEILRIGEVRVWMQSSEILLVDTMSQSRRVSTENTVENGCGIGDRGAMHGIEAEPKGKRVFLWTDMVSVLLEIFSVEQLGDLFEVKLASHELDVVFSRVHDPHCEQAFLRSVDVGELIVCSGNLEINNLSEVEVAGLIFGEFLGNLEGFVREVFKCRASVFDVVLDSEVVFWASSIVTGCEDDCSDAVAYLLVKFTDIGGNCWGGHDTILRHMHLVDSVRQSDLENYVDRLSVEESTVATYN